MDITARRELLHMVLVHNSNAAPCGSSLLAAIGDAMLGTDVLP